MRMNLKTESDVAEVVATLSPAESRVYDEMVTIAADCGKCGGSGEVYQAWEGHVSCPACCSTGSRAVTLQDEIAIVAHILDRRY